ncbi:MAG: 2Fe-2S iron-sulfur cluster-binding protein [Actinomycetota bacterium]
MDEVAFELDGRRVQVPDDGGHLLAALRERLGVRSVKDGCSPQGQCGCCTVLVDGAPRVACVTPLRRVAGRSVTTVDGLDPASSRQWAEAFCATGASQCGFCTPGILVRLEGHRQRRGGLDDRAAVDKALAAHLCRCTGWQTIVEAATAMATDAQVARPDRDLDAAARRAEIEGGVPQEVSPDVALGRSGFADDTAPDDALVAVPADDGSWAVGESLAEALERAGKVQGRRTTLPVSWPIDVPEGEWDATLRTTWVEPAYLEPDASWCVPGGEPASPLANGGAFGGKAPSLVTGAARQLADLHDRPVRVLLPREWVVRWGPKRPPIAAGIRADGTGVIRAVRTDGFAELLADVAPQLVVEEVDVEGPPTSMALRAAGWAEVAVLRAALSPEGSIRVVDPTGAGWAEAEVDDAGVRVRVGGGPPLDETVLRSYAVGAAHQALGWVGAESLTVDEAGEPHDLTIRSFGVLRSSETPPIAVEIEAEDGPPVRAGDAAFAAVAAAVWRARGCPRSLPTSEASS